MGQNFKHTPFPIRVAMHGRSAGSLSLEDVEALIRGSYKKKGNIYHMHRLQRKVKQGKKPQQSGSIEYVRRGIRYFVDQNDQFSWDADFGYMFYKFQVIGVHS